MKPLDLASVGAHLQRYFDAEVIETLAGRTWSQALAISMKDQRRGRLPHT